MNLEQLIAQFRVDAHDTETPHLFDDKWVAGWLTEAVAEAAKDLDAAYVIGGAQIYEAFLPFVDVMHITEVDHTFEGDAFFPEFDASQFEIVETIEGTVDEKNKYPHKFVTYKRK